jgi:hypothetical protein
MRQHGGVADTCIHGFAPGTCLICQTLQGGASTATKQDTGGARPKRGRRPDPLPTPAQVAVRPDRVTPPERRGSGGLGLKLFGVLVLAIVAIIGVWIIVGLVLAVLHIVELIAAALVAGWVGWTLGVHHGRHSRT